jgi:hypothetical protein
MNRNVKQTRGLLIAATVMAGGMAFLTVPNGVRAQEAIPTVQQVQQPQGIFESEKAWKFEKDNLVFFNPSPNPGGTRFIRWKDYTWVVAQNQITVIDERPYGTQLQGQRGQLTKDGPQKDKDLMNDLKRQAGDIRKGRDPNEGGLPGGLGIGIGLGLGFGFGGYDDHRGRGSHHHR